MKPKANIHRQSKELRRKQKRMKFIEQFKTSLFILPSFIGVSIFFIIPFVIIVYYSVTNPAGKFVGTVNFQNVLKNQAFLQASRDTALFSAVAVPLAIIIPLILAVLLTKNIPLKSVFRSALISPLMVPVASIVLIWEIIFNFNGVLNEALAGFLTAPVDWLKSEYNQIPIILLFLWKNAGYNMILFMSALANIPHELIEAANLDGASKTRIFWKIKFPFLTSSIFFVGILSIINSFKIFREVYLLTGKYPYGKLYMLQHFMNNIYQNLDYQKLSSAAVIMFCVMIVIIGALFFMDSRLGKDFEE